MSYAKYAKYVGWTILGGVLLWFLFVIAGLGSWWVSIGVVAFMGLMASINRLTRRPAPRTGQPTPKRRVISTDRDRWGGGASF